MTSAVLAVSGHEIRALRWSFRLRDGLPPRTRPECSKHALRGESTILCRATRDALSREARSGRH
jgi:hypothetical protein